MTIILNIIIVLYALMLYINFVLIKDYHKLLEKRLKNSILNRMIFIFMMFTPVPLISVVIFLLIIIVNKPVNWLLTGEYKFSDRINNWLEEED